MQSAHAQGCAAPRIVLLACSFCKSMVHLGGSNSHRCASQSEGRGHGSAYARTCEHVRLCACACVHACMPHRPLFPHTAEMSTCNFQNFTVYGFPTSGFTPLPVSTRLQEQHGDFQEKITACSTTLVHQHKEPQAVQGVVDKSHNSTGNNADAIAVFPYDRKSDAVCPATTKH